MRPITEDTIGLKVVCDPSGNGKVQSIVYDIVAVHGMGAHPIDTWCSKLPGDVNSDAQDQTSETTQYFDWLSHETMLPEAMADARIMRFGYRSDSWGAEAVQTRGKAISRKLIHELHNLRRDCQTRPLIFIAHSFGGLVVLRTLLDARLSPIKYPGMYTSVIGLVFFSVPFRGTDQEFSQGRLLDLAEELHADTEVYKENHGIFRSGSDSLLDTVDDFLETTAYDARPRIFCFYENRKTDIGRLLNSEGKGLEPQTMSVVLVNEHSGCLDSDRSTQKWSRDSDHYGMNKFLSPEQGDFQRLKDELSEMRKFGQSIIERRIRATRSLNPEWTDTEVTEILKWLSPQANPDPERRPIDRHHELLEKHHPDTCGWVLEREEFKNWVSFERPIDPNAKAVPPLLWLYGNPGAGKSVIVAQLVEELKSKPVLSLYCEFDHKRSQTRKALLCNGIRQAIEFLNHFKPIPKHLHDAWRKYKTEGGGLPVHECPGLLSSIVQEIGGCFIVLDGLDEYDPTEFSRYTIDIFEDLYGITQQCGVPCRMLVASRHNVYHSYKGTSKIELCAIEVKAHDEDVAAFVRSKMLEDGSRLSKMLQGNKPLQIDVVETLCQNAQGVFLLPYLHLKMIEAKGSAREIQDALPRLPSKLFQMYELALRRIQKEAETMEESEGSGVRIIEIVLCSARRLRLIELKHALATRRDDTSFDQTGCYDGDEILARTGGLLTIGPDGVVLFMHHTVRECLNQPHVYGNHFQDGHLRLAQKCIAYVSFTALAQPHNNIVLVHQQYPFLRYAARWLGYHVSQCIDNGSITIEAAKKFLTENVRLGSFQVVATRILTMCDADRMNHVLRDSSTLHLAILWDIPPVVKFLVSEGAKLEARGFKGVTPLHQAARTTSVSSTKLLLDARADASSIEIEGRTALDLIVTRPWRDMILRIRDWQLLEFLTQEVKKYVKEAMDQKIDDKSPEEYAVQKILEQKPGGILQPNPFDIMKDFHQLRHIKEEYAQMSHLIIQSMQLDISDDGEKVAIMLVKSGVDVNSLDVEETTALQLAALYGRKELVWTLLEHGANPFLQGLLGFNALEIASIRAAKVPQRLEFKLIKDRIEEVMIKVEELEAQQSDEDQKKNTRTMSSSRPGGNEGLRF